jgi:protein arginine N-methyltransferase 1
MYSLHGYGKMIADRVRMDAYAQALREAIRPDSTVLDIGAGTGVMSLLAAKFGARKVIAVEPSSAIHIARELAAANGMADRIEFIRDVSTNISLTDRVDVIVSDLRGILPLHQHHLPSIMDARERFLSSTGRLIPRKDRLWVALVETVDAYAALSAGWTVLDGDVDLLPLQKYMTNLRRKEECTPDQLLMAPQCWADLDYTTLISPNVAGEAAAVATRAGVAHGLCLWFDTQLTENVGFSTGPSDPKAIYGRLLLPLSAPVEVEAGDAISLKLRADLVNADYIWQWETRITSAVSTPGNKADFKQSTFFGAPLALDELRRKAADYVPHLNENGRVDLFILSCLTGGLSLGEIARRACAEFPQQFTAWHAALKRVAQVASRYDRRGEA